MRTSGFTTIFFILILILIYFRVQVVTDIFSMSFWRNYHDTFEMDKQDGDDMHFIVAVIVFICFLFCLLTLSSLLALLACLFCFD